MARTNEEKTRRLVVELTESTYKKLDELQDITGKWKKQIITELIDAELTRQIRIKEKALS